MDANMKRALCDADPSVMAAALTFFVIECEKRPLELKELIPTFSQILRQIVDHRLARDYDYHRMPAPWVQMNLMQIMANLAKGDKEASESLYELLAQVLKKSDDVCTNIGYALVYQTLKTIAAIYPSQSLIDLATTTIARFLSSESHNLKYIGITGLASIV